MCELIDDVVSVGCPQTGTPGNDLLPSRGGVIALSNLPWIRETIDRQPRTARLIDSAATPAKSHIDSIYLAIQVLGGHPEGTPPSADFGATDDPIVCHGAGVERHFMAGTDRRRRTWGWHH
jgi:hypothetical protein